MEETLAALLPCRPVLPATARWVLEQLTSIKGPSNARQRTLELTLVRGTPAAEALLTSSLIERLPHIPLLHIVHVRAAPVLSHGCAGTT